MQKNDPIHFFLGRVRSLRDDSSKDFYLSQKVVSCYKTLCGSFSKAPGLNEICPKSFLPVYQSQSICRFLILSGVDGLFLLKQ